jgi:hypothetical protein
MRAVPRLARRHGKPRTAIAVPGLAIGLPNATPWMAPAVRVSAPDPGRWPSGEPWAGREGAPNGWWVMYTLDTQTDIPGA